MFIATLQNKRLLGLAQTILYRTKIYIPPANIQNNVVLNPGKKVIMILSRMFLLCVRKIN
jgi:hypothetical protein